MNFFNKILKFYQKRREIFFSLILKYNPLFYNDLNYYFYELKNNYKLLAFL